MKSLSLVSAAAALLATMSFTAGPASANRIEVGTLKCDVDGGGSFIIGSSKNLECVFYRAAGGTEAYSGQIDRLGLDIGITGREVIVWTVLAATDELAPGELGGTYAGVSADASAGVGGGANLLVGGGARTISLQPLSLQVQSGINIAVGISALVLEPTYDSNAFLEPSAASVDVDITLDDADERTAIMPRRLSYGCGDYVVMLEGDTISGIARRCRVTVDAILEANPDIRNVREIPVHTVISMPKRTGHPGAYPCGEDAIIQPGETIDDLAWRCGLTLRAVMRENPDVRSADLRPGLVLRLPLD